MQNTEVLMDFGILLDILLVLWLKIFIGMREATIVQWW
jgi:hypothetical protein